MRRKGRKEFGVGVLERCLAINFLNQLPAINFSIELLFSLKQHFPQP